MSVRPAATRDRLIEQVDGMCVYGCGRPADHLDHIRPRARGGRNSLANLAPCCITCGTSKGAMTVVEWVLEMAARIAAGETPDLLAAEVAQVAA